jgi:hypothetical protein
MEMSQQNTLYNYTNKNILFFKNRDQEGKTDPVWGLVPVGGDRIKKRLVNMVQILCTPVCKWKNETC